MRSLFRPHVLVVIGGFAIGLAFGIFVMDTQPPIFGWLFGAGAGIVGGTFIAAIASGQQIISGPAPPGGRGRRLTPTPEELDEIERGLPHLLDDLPPVRDDDA
ncbi:MAG: hypothetical protein O3B31_03380 [Chloroflexi bacterium]|nr:hypothetical protein [Chloroflexota bacterium]MDA1002381.1 hypothetical protein [Chloroflexota bacterium]